MPLLSQPVTPEFVAPLDAIRAEARDAITAFVEANSGAGALELEREGVIVTHHGKGSFVAPDPALSPRLYEEELGHHLDRAAELGTSLGMTEKEIVHRLRKAVDHASETRLEKENS
jgi:GntR family transcriptional regulator